MTDISALLGANVITAGNAGVERAGVLYGDPALHAARVMRAHQMILETANFTAGSSLTPSISAAMKLAELAMGLVSSRDPIDILGQAVTELAILGRVLGAEEKINRKKEREAEEAERTRRVAKMVGADGRDGGNSQIAQEP